jgi:membrane protein implicated in regulation of membrane protease activity
MHSVPAWLIWVVAAAVLAGGELLSLDLVLIMLAGAAGAAAGAAALGSGPLLQAVVFAVVAVGLLAGVRPIARRHLSVGHTRTGVEALTGAPALVLETVDQHNGRVKIGGEVWTARPYDETQTFAAGEHVHVMQISGATALVWRQP